MSRMQVATMRPKELEAAKRKLQAVLGEIGVTIPLSRVEFEIVALGVAKYIYPEMSCHDVLEVVEWYVDDLKYARRLE